MKKNGTAFCGFGPQAGMIPMQISTGILMSQLLILYWNAWPSPEESGKNRCCWIMDVEKEEWIFFWHIRQAAVPSELSMMTGFMKKQ